MTVYWKKSVGLFIALIGFYLLALGLYAAARIAGADLTSPWTLLLYTASQLVGFGILWRLEGLPALYHGGLSQSTILRALVFWLIAFGLWYPLSLIFRALGLPVGSSWGFWPRQGLWTVPVAIWAVGAAFFEEGFYRGYAVPRLTPALRSTVAAVLVSSAFFGLIHLRFGVFLAFYTFVFGLIAGVLYVSTRSTWACFVYHLVNNVVVDFVIYGLLIPQP